jgi:phage gp46-like protein
MIDLAVGFNAERFDFDLTLDGSGAARDLLGDDGLLTAVIISLFTDRRANADDPLPDERVGVPSDMRGWWGDFVPEEDAPYAERALGSRLWLLSREKDMDVVIARAQRYAEEAVEWLLRARRVTRITVAASRVAPSYLGIAVRALPAPGMGDVTREWNFVFDYINAAPVKIETPGV